MMTSKTPLRVSTCSHIRVFLGNGCASLSFIPAHEQQAAHQRMHGRELLTSCEVIIILSQNQKYTALSPHMQPAARKATGIPEAS
jgi:hypothetical protein